jgi:hypothetical protein
VRTRQLSDLQADVQKRADVVGALQAFPLTDITEAINQGWARVYGLLTQTGENYYLTEFSFSTVSGQDTYYTTSAVGVPAGAALLPTDMYRVKRVDAQPTNGPEFRTCSRFQFDAGNDYPQSGWAWPLVPMYDYQGSGAQAALQFVPVPPAAQPIRLWYYPVAVRLVNATDVIDGGNGWEIYAIDWAARRIAERDENYELCARIDLALAEMEANIKREAASRNAGQAPKVRRSGRYKHRGAWGGGGMR